MANTITIYPDRDQFTSQVSNSGWSAVRDATGGLEFPSSSSSATAIRATFTAARPSAIYSVARVGILFDVSSITVKPKASTLSVKGITNGACEVACVKGTITPSGMGFPGVDGWVNGADNDGNATHYASVDTSWSTSGYNQFLLNETALNDIAGSTTLSITLIDYQHDLKNVSPSAISSPQSGVIFSEYTGTSSDPNLKIQTSDDAIFFGTNF